jgi:hypothetical protein
MGGGGSPLRGRLLADMITAVAKRIGLTIVVAFFVHSIL